MCGEVRLVTPRKPRRVGLRHWLECRKHHGAVLYASYILRGRGHDPGRDREYKRRHLCPTCGSSVFGRCTNEIEVHRGRNDQRATPTDARAMDGAAKGVATGSAGWESWRRIAIQSSAPIYG
jgi:hypothetical protein